MNGLWCCGYAGAAVLLLAAGCSHGDAKGSALGAGQPAGVAVPAGPAGSSGPAPASAAGLRVYIDPATGQPRDPTDAELAADAARRNAARIKAQAASGGTETSRVTTLPSGEVRVYVGDQGGDDERVCRQPDGRFADCPGTAGKP